MGETDCEGNWVLFWRHNCIHLTHWQSNAQNSPSQASPVCELWTSRCSSWIRNGRGTRDQIANICWVIEKAREFQKNIYVCFIDYLKTFDNMDQNKLGKVLKEMGISDHLTCLLRNLYTGQGATVRTRHGTTDWFQTWKGIYQGCLLSPCLFNLHAEDIMWNARLDEAQAGIKIAKYGRKKYQ